MAVQTMYHNQSVTLSTHPSLQTNQLTKSPISSINGQILQSYIEPTTRTKAALSQHKEPIKNHRISLVNFSEPSKQSTLKTNLGNINILDEEIRRIVSEMVKDKNKKQDIMFITTC
eukprot:362450_1